MLSSWIFYFGIPILLSVSAAFQLILTIFGSFRKGSSKKWFTLLLWSAYQLADVVATTGLGMVASHTQAPAPTPTPGDGVMITSYATAPAPTPTPALGDKVEVWGPYFRLSVWSSFLLWHLGGPDSITAFSLVDNELCYRHSFQLIYQVAVASYIHFKLFLLIKGYIFIAILIIFFLAGVSKCVEKTWALHSANMASLRDSIIPPPNPGPISVTLDDDDDDDDDDDGEEDHNDVADAQSISVPIPMDEYAYGMVAASEPAEGTSLSDSIHPPPNLGPGPRSLNLNDDDDDDDYHTDATTAQSISVSMFMHEYASGMDTTTTLAKGTGLRDSLFTAPNAAPRPLILNDEDDDYNDVVNVQSIPMPVPMDEYVSGMVVAPAPVEETLLEEQLDSNKAILLRGHHYFCIFRCLFVDLIVPYPHIIDSQRVFLQYPCNIAFQLIDVELSFMYDMLFTKVPVIRTCRAFTLRLFRVFVLLVILISSFLQISILTLSSPLTWAFVQEMFEIIQMLLSEWTVVWMNNHKLNCLSTIILRLILSSRWLVSKIIFFCSCGVKEVASETTTIWWHNNIMAQYNLLSFCFKDEPTMFKRTLNLSSWGKSIHEWIETSCNTTYIHIPNNIKDFIYQQFKEMVQTFDEEEIRSAEFRNLRGKWAMKRNNCRGHNCLEELSWSVDVEFDRSILIWHVVTDFCYCYDDLDSDKCEATTILQVQVSKALSNYLLYLLLTFPFMLNNRIGKIRFQDTCATAKKLFDVLKDKGQKKSKPFSFILQRKKSSLDEKRAKAYIMRLLRSNAQSPIRETRSDESKSVLLEAYRLAKLMQLYTKEERWKIISGIWVEMLSYAANNCAGKHHAQRLCDGGEFLTKIWLLMAHLGMLE